MKLPGRPRAYVFIAAFLGTTGIAAGFLLSSLSYRMPSAQVQTASGDASSTGFINESTVGQSFTGVSTSSNYKLKVGYFRKTKLPASTSTQTIDPNVDNTLAVDLPSGQVTVQIPAGAFSQAVTITLQPPSSLADAVSNAGTLQGTSIAVEILTSPELQPQKPVTLTFPYHSEFINGINEDQLRIAFYVPSDNRWAPIDSSVDKSQLTVTGRTTHFTIFRVVGMGPGASLGSAFIYPNPLRPALGHLGMNFTNLPAGVSIKIFTPSGELVRQLTTDAAGRAFWDGANDKGQKVSSGVYLGLLQGGGDKKVLKLAVER